MSDELVWENPPPVDRGSWGQATDRYDGLVEALKSRPGKWAKVPQSYYIRANDLAGRARAGAIKAFQPAGAFQAQVRAGELYLRYLPGVTSIGHRSA